MRRTQLRRWPARPRDLALAEREVKLDRRRKRRTARDCRDKVRPHVSPAKRPAAAAVYEVDLERDHSPLTRLAILRYRRRRAKSRRKSAVTKLTAARQPSHARKVQLKTESICVMTRSYATIRSAVYGTFALEITLCRTRGNLTRLYGTGSAGSCFASKPARRSLKPRGGPR